MTVSPPPVKAGGWRIDPPHPPTGSTGAAYALTFGKHKGKRLDQVPVEYVLWLIDFAPSPALRLLAKRFLDLDVVLDEGDPCQVAEPSGELAAHVVPRLCAEFEAALLAEFGHLEPCTVEAAAVERCREAFRKLVTEYTGRRFPTAAELGGAA